MIPESLYYENITESLVDGAFADSRAVERSDYALKVLLEYAKALVAVRKSGIIDYQKFSNGL
ncbi:MAG: hypothetical protein AAB390_05235 [Patescibacteria group bacterium]